MSNRKLLSKILRLQSLKITKFWFKNREQELHLAVKPYKNGCRCPTCGRRGRIVHQTTDWRRWEDIAVMGLRVLLWYAPKEIRCPTHGRVQEDAVGEGLNRIIKIVKNRASGYRHLDYFADMIYLTVGDLDIPAQIPSELRTL